MAYRIVLYIRLSSEDFDLHENGKEESNSVQNQKDLLNHFVLSKPDFNDATITSMTDDGYSGTNFQRPAIAELLDLARENKIDCIIVKDFSRFGRNYLEVCDYLDQIFPFLGIRFISVNDNYDSAMLNGKTGGIEVAFRNIMYGYYSKDLSKKVKSARHEKSLKGDYINGYAPFGYQKSKDNVNQLIIEPLSGEIVRNIFEMACSGMNCTKIARVLNANQIEPRSVYKNKSGVRTRWHKLNEKVIWNNSVISYILRNESYLGKVINEKRYCYEIGSCKTFRNKRSDWIVVDDMHESLVSIETFEKAQDIMKEFEEKDLTGRTTYLFTKKLRCGACFHSLARASKMSGRYHCTSKYVDESSICMKKSISEKDIADAVLKGIKSYVKTFLRKEQLKKKRKNRNIAPSIEKQISVYKNAIKKCEYKKCDFYDKSADGVITKQEYVIQRDKIDIEQKEFEKLVDDLSAKLIEEQKHQYEYTELPQEDVLREYLKIKTLTREMVTTFVKCVYVYADHSINIQWNFDDFN